MNIVYKAVAIKDLKRIGSAEKKKIKKKILSLLSDPLSGKPLKGKYRGIRSLKVWPLRVLYTFESTAQVITILTIDYRGRVYK